MTINRRHFLGAAAMLAAMPRLAIAETLTADGFIELRAGPATLKLLEDDAKTSAWLLGPGPEPAVLRAKQGLEFKLRFINDLPQEIWLHFFGVRGPSDVMSINVPSGADHAVDCVFTPPDAGTFWIGPMADQSKTRDMGLYAVLVVEEAEPPLGLADIVLVLDDWKLEDSGAIEPSFGDVEIMVGEGRLGNWFTVNNRYRPRLQLAAGRFTRARILNAANVRVMSLVFKGYDPMLIARDGQPVKPAGLEGQALVLAPGQRADLLISPEEGDVYMAFDLFEDVVEIAYLIPADRNAPPPAIADNFTLPANPLPPLGDLAQARRVNLVLEGGIKGGLKSAMLNGAERDLRTLLENGKGWAINGVAGPAPEPLFSATTGETIILDVDNRTAFAQPIHIHGHVWQVIAAEPSGQWQDTAMVAAGARIALAFVASNPGLWALHGLVAERADGGLMRSFSVIDSAG